MNSNDNLAQQVGQQHKAGPKLWARQIIERHERGEWVYQVALEKAREALRPSREPQ